MVFKLQMPPTCCFYGFAIKLFLISITTVSESSSVFSFSKTNPLAGKSLMIIPISLPIQFRVYNDSTKLQRHMPRPTKAQIDILNWLAARYKFTHVIMATNETTLETPVTSGNKGSLSYLLDKTCDLVLGAFVMTSGRYQVVDLPFPWLQRPLRFLIPVSDARANFYAVFKPFQFPVWIFLTVSIVTVIVALESCVLLYRTFNIQAKKESHHKRAFTSPISLYVAGIILFQGGPCITPKNSIRLVVGVWCLACLVLVQAYNCTLIPYVIAPNTQPLIKSVYDIERNPDIRLQIEKNMGYDIMFSEVTDNDHGIFRVLRDRVNAYPDSRCDLVSQCLDKVESGGPYVYPKTLEYLLDAMLIDYKDTGKCRMQIAKDGFWNVLVTFALQKHSSYTAFISKGFMEMNAFGLIEYWTTFHAANPYQCLDQSAARRKKQFVNPRLSLKNLTGAFVVLGFGCVVSLLFFFLERLKFARKYSR